MIEDLLWWTAALKAARGAASDSLSTREVLEMTSALVQSRSPNLIRTITHRTRGLTRGPVTRLMSPSDLGEILKPFVFLDLFDHVGPPFNGALHPHSGIATLTYVAEGAVTYIDPNGERGILTAGGVEWMQAGRGMWHGGGLDQSGRRAAFSSGLLCPGT